MVVNFSLDEIASAVKELLAHVGEAKVLAFHGEMGAGKTTFIEAICRAWGVEDHTGSPTFSIINEYQTADGQPVYHMDLYRLKDEAEAIQAGVEDCLYSGFRCLVEWPEKAPGIFPPDTVHIWLKLTGGGTRRLEINP